MMLAAASTPVALTIAGSDSSGGAGIQADLKTFAAFGVYGASALTALTAQNTTGVQAVKPVEASFVVAQIEAVLSDLGVGAIKTGMLANSDIIRAVSVRLAQHRQCPLVVDPVMVATSGDVLLEREAIAWLKSDLIPMAMIITPNLSEAAALLNASPAGDEAEAVAQARALHRLGPGAVLIKGGHAQGELALDIFFDGSKTKHFARPRIDTSHSHGTGCVLSAAIAALLAQGIRLEEAVGRAKAFVWHGLQAGRTLGVGHGRGPVDPLFAIRKSPPPA